MKILNILLMINLLVVSGYSIYDINRQSGENKLTLKAFEKVNRELNLLQSEVISIKASHVKLNGLIKRANLIESSLSPDISGQKNSSPSYKGTAENIIPAEQLNPIEMEKKEQEKQAKKQESINNVFLAETADASWSPEATSLIKSYFDSKDGEKLNLVDYECRTTLCKLEIAKPKDSSSDDNLMVTLPMHVMGSLSQGTVFYNNNEDGSTSVTVYLVRNGYEPPA